MKHISISLNPDKVILLSWSEWYLSRQAAEVLLCHIENEWADASPCFARVKANLMEQVIEIVVIIVSGARYKNRVAWLSRIIGMSCKCIWQNASANHSLLLCLLSSHAKSLFALNSIELSDLLEKIVTHFGVYNLFNTYALLKSWGLDHLLRFWSGYIKNCIFNFKCLFWHGNLCYLVIVLLCNFLVGLAFLQLSSFSLPLSILKPQCSELEKECLNSSSSHYKHVYNDIEGSYSNDGPSSFVL